MSETAAQILQKAYELVEADQYQEAEALLEPLLVQHPDNPAVWWVYSHAVKDSEKGIEALNNVLRLDPDYPGARNLHEVAEGELGEQIDFVDMPLVDTPAPAEYSEAIVRDEVTHNEVLEEHIEQTQNIDRLIQEALQENEEKAEGGGWRTLALILFIAAITIGGVILLLNGGGNGASTNTANRDDILTQLTGLDVGDSENYDAFLDDMEQFQLTGNGFEVLDTDVGRTLVAHVCSDGNQNTTLNRVMQVFVDNIEGLGNVNGYGADIAQCNQEGDVRSPIIGVSIEETLQLARQEISSRDFQAAWRPLQMQ